MKTKHFCTCRDYKCPNHPVNHDSGCDPCIQKNLRRGEIPSCFFRKVVDDLKGIEDFTYEGFAKVLQQRKK